MTKNAMPPESPFWIGVGLVLRSCAWAAIGLFTAFFYLAGSVAEFRYVGI